MTASARSRSARPGFLILCLMLLATLVAPVPALAGGASIGSGAPTAEQIDAVGDGLPDDPREAALILVELIFGDDARVARAATGELLRRAGFAIVTSDGAGVAVPDGVVLYDLPVIVETLVELSDSVRDGTGYSGVEIAALFADLGIAEGEELPATEVLAALGAWGKGEDALAESVVAGAAVRALSARRGDVLWSGADPSLVVVDPLQTLLVVGHLTSRELVPSDAGSWGDSSQGVDALYRPSSTSGAFAGTGLCRDLKALMEAMKPGRTYLDVATANPLGDHLSGKLKEKVLSERAKAALERFSKVKGVADKGAAALGVILLLLGARLDVKHASGGTGQWKTHFSHESDESGKHLHLEAHATFDSSLAGNRIECWSLAGVELPKAGPMEGFTVRWSMEQSIGRIQQGGRFLTTASSDSQKFASGSGGEKLGSSGVSKVELVPAIEKQKPQSGQRELSGTVVVTAKLDEAKLPLDLSNIWDWKGATIDLALDALKRVGLPSVTKTVTVTYHGTDIFVAKGAADVFLLYVTLPVFVDIYSCTGPEGPWLGSGGFGSWNKEFLAFATESVFGVDIPDEEDYVNENIRFMVNPNAVDQPFPVTSPDPFVSGLMNLDLGWLSRLEGARPHGNTFSRPAGTVELLLAGESFPFANLTYPIKWVPFDDRCPRTEFTFP